MFGDWRAELRSMARTIESSPEDGAAFEKEAREVVSDGLLPRAREVEKAVSRSSVMRSAATEQGLNLGVGAAALTGAAGLAGAPLAPAAIASLGLSAVGRWVYSSVFGRSETGTRGILATLIKKR